MAWLRIDDGFSANSKIVQLSDAQLRVWIRLLCHCAKSEDPTIDRAAIREISGLDKRRVSTYVALGLLDKIGDDFEVHNWAKYLPKEAQNAARQAKWRARRRNAERNGQVDAAVTDSASHARAGTRGTRPVPSPDVTPDEDLSFLPSEAKDADGRKEESQPEQIKGEAQALLARLQHGAAT